MRWRKSLQISYWLFIPTLLEVSCEDEEFNHGVFTYYVLERLSGRADADGNGTVTVDERGIKPLFITQLICMAHGELSFPT